MSSDINIKIDNVKYIINNIDIYASLLKNENCEFIISELSGGGEFSQYCHEKKIYLYSNSYIIKDFSSSLPLLQTNNKLHHNWNKHGTTNATLYHYKNIDELLLNF